MRILQIESSEDNRKNRIGIAGISSAGTGSGIESTNIVFLQFSLMTPELCDYIEKKLSEGFTDISFGSAGWIKATPNAVITLLMKKPKLEKHTPVT
jgi:hypothetical protein